MGSGALRSKTPMLSRPRKPPSKTFLPNRSLRFTHQVKFSKSLLNADFEEIDVRLTAQRLLGAMEEQGRPGVDRRVHVAEVPLIGRHLAAGVEVVPRSISSICCFAKSGSTIEIGSVWKARSQAAYQGYSHLSGMEMMSSLTM